MKYSSVGLTKDSNLSFLISLVKVVSSGMKLPASRVSLLTHLPQNAAEPFPPLALEKPSCQLPPRRNCSNSPSPSPGFTAAPGSESRFLTTVVLGRSIESPFEVRILWEIARVSSESFCFWPGSPFGSGNRAGHPWSSGLSRFAKTESGQTSVQEFESGGS